MLRSINMDNSIFYNLTFKDSDVRSTILNHDISRKFYTMGLTKRINLNNIFVKLSNNFYLYLYNYKLKEVN